MVSSGSNFSLAHELVLTSQQDDALVPLLMSYTSYKTRWYAHLDALHSHSPRIFSRSELRRVSKRGVGAFRFEGIGLSSRNCLGIRQVYEVYHEPRLRKQRSGSAEFKHFEITISQFVRTAICLSVCPKEVVWEEQV